MYLFSYTKFEYCIPVQLYYSRVIKRRQKGASIEFSQMILTIFLLIEKYKEDIDNGERFYEIVKYKKNVMVYNAQDTVAGRYKL